MLPVLFNALARRGSARAGTAPSRHKRFAAYWRVARARAAAVPRVKVGVGPGWTRRRAAA
jgi:hypothetical protein